MIAEAIPRVVEVEAPADLEAVRLLLMSHAAALRGHLGSGALLTDAMRLPGPYVPVLGRLYLARLEGSAAGCVGLRPLGPTVGEVKRLYVVPAEPGGWLRRDRYEERGEQLNPVSAQKARTITWYVYGDVGQVTIAAE